MSARPERGEGGTTHPLRYAIDRATLALQHAPSSSGRRMSDLAGIFLDEAARLALAAGEDPVVYRVDGVEAPPGGGALSFGLGVIEPGQVGEEYFMTKGHAHERRDAAEVYVGLSGSGLMLLEDIRDGRCEAIAFGADQVIYVPGFTAHRTVNVGDVPLAYLGIFPSDAGHDYESIAARGFRQVVLAGPDGPRIVERHAAGGAS